MSDKVNRRCHWWWSRPLPALAPIFVVVKRDQTLSLLWSVNIPLVSPAGLLTEWWALFQPHWSPRPVIKLCSRRWQVGGTCQWSGKQVNGVKIQTSVGQICLVSQPTSRSSSVVILRIRGLLDSGSIRNDSKIKKGSQFCLNLTNGHGRHFLGPFGEILSWRHICLVSVFFSHTYILTILRKWTLFGVLTEKLRDAGITVEIYLLKLYKSEGGRGGKLWEWIKNTKKNVANNLLAVLFER